MFFGHFLATKKFHKPLYKIDNENTVVSVSVSVSAETENHFRFWYRFRQKRNMAISACFGFGRNKKKPFGRALILFHFSLRYHVIWLFQNLLFDGQNSYFSTSTQINKFACEFCRLVVRFCIWEKKKQSWSATEPK